jgi:preprotein translocase subunit SecD
MLNKDSYLRDNKIITLIIIFVALLILDFIYGIHLGIEFVGGTQIPVMLEHSVNVTAMSQLITALNQRLSTFGLQQVTIEGIGNSQVYVIIPKASKNEINQTISIIDSQGKFDGIVNGKEAINGSDILSDSIGALQPQVVNNTVLWQVDFFIINSAEKPFANAVFGQGNKPIYMFLDRPTSAIVLINSSVLSNSALTPSYKKLAAMQAALEDGNNTIPIVTVSGTQASINTAKAFLLNNKNKYKKIIASDNLNQSLLTYAKSLNYSIILENQANITPTFISNGFNSTIVDSWPAVGLISAPILSPSLAQGNVTNSFQISGSAPLNLTTTQEKINYAENESKKIVSVLSGGALPVAVIPGTPTVIPPTLGSHFLYVSAIAGIVAILFVSMFMVFRYKKLFLVVPILLTTIMELFIIVSVIGMIGTIDLAAVAGIIAVIGTGVDAQIIITDEIINKGHESTAKSLLNNAFYIVWTDAALLIVAMLPLFFSTSLVSVIGFSESTIFGALLSVFITRPAYGAIISKHYSKTS